MHWVTYLFATQLEDFSYNKLNSDFLMLIKNIKKIIIWSLNVIFLNFLIRNTFFNYFLIVRTSVCFLTIPLYSQTGYHFISMLVGFRTVALSSGTLLRKWKDIWAWQRRRAITAWMSHCAMTQRTQCKNMKSPNRNLETNCKFDQINSK